MTGICRECEAPISYDADADLDKLECPSCGELACAQCALCDQRVSPEDFAARQGHEECQEADRRAQEMRDRDPDEWRWSLRRVS